jgi:hypothetical protein
MPKYYWLLIRTACKHSITGADLLSSIVAAVIGIITHFLPEGEKAAASLAWQVPVWAFVGVITCRLILAPYWIWRDDQEKIAALIAASHDKHKNIRIRLGEFLEQGRVLMRRCANEKEAAPEDEAQEWANAAEDYMRANLDESYVARFRDGSDLPLGVTTINSAPHRQLWSGIKVRVARLQQFVSEMAVK